MEHQETGPFMISEFLSSYRDTAEGVSVGDIFIPPAVPPFKSQSTTNGRTIITHIENEFFKSYAGTQVLGPFHKSFSAIIGPNGSGKSNVIDSMLFVFGYRASKIRSKKISILIHNSTKYPNVNSCSVIVHFAKILDKDDDTFEVIPNSNFTISRTAFKDNSSYYMINKKKVHFKEVGILLRKHGIDLDHNRFLILQGEVEQISMMKSKGENPDDVGMLEYLEDIIGTSRFKEPIKKLEEIKVSLNDEKTKKSNRIAIVEKERDDLCEMKDKAVDYLKYKNKSTRVNNSLIQIFRKNNLITLKENEIKLKEIKEDISHEDKLCEEINECLQNNKQQTDQLTKKLKKKEQIKEKLTKEFDKLNVQDASLNEDLKEINKKCKKFKNKLNEENKKVVDFEQLPQKNEKLIKDLGVKKEKLTLELQKYEEQFNTELAGLASETTELKQQKEELQTQLLNYRKTVDETKAEYDVVKMNWNLANKNKNSEKEKYQQLKTHLESQKEELNIKKEKFQKLDKSYPVLVKDLKQVELDLEKNLQKERNILEQLNKAKVNYDECCRMMQNNKSSSKILNYLMNLKSEGQIPGFYGRLGDLGGIDLKYDVAISTACPTLENLVVDTANTAERCIQILKQYNLGRATFIVVDKQQYLRNHYSSPKSYPPGAQRLFDLVQVPDDNIRPVFYYALRETLVTDTLANASQIAYNYRVRYRVVTLKGELIESTGTMSGGGNHVMRGRMNQNAVPDITMTQEHKQQVEIDLQNLEQETRQIKEIIINLTCTRDSLRQQLHQVKTERIHHEATIKNIESSLPDLEKRTLEQQQKSEQLIIDPEKLDELKTTMELKKTNYDTAMKSAKEFETKVDAIHQKIINLTEGKMKSKQNKLNDLKKTINKVSQEMSSLKVAVTSSEREIVKSKKLIENLEKEIEDFQNKIVEIKEKSKQIENHAGELLKKIEEITNRSLEIEQNINELRKVSSLKNTELNEIKAKKVDLSVQRDNLIQSVKEKNDKASHYNKTLKDLKLQQIPGLLEEDPLKEHTEDELNLMDSKKLQYDLTLIDSELKNAQPNLGAIDDYLRKAKQYELLANELKEVIKHIYDLCEIIKNLRMKKLTEFIEGYGIISSNLKETYQMLTLGGDAELEFINNADPFSEGVVFSVRPPRKSWKNISVLSGGEKTLASLALVFALHHYRPSPLYVMDEIDAALDTVNVSIVGYFIKERTKNTQFIIISLRTNMFELADQMIGIFKTYDCTQSIAINPNKYGIEKYTHDLSMVD